MSPRPTAGITTGRGAGATTSVVTSRLHRRKNLSGITEGMAKRIGRLGPVGHLSRVFATYLVGPDDA